MKRWAWIPLLTGLYLSQGLPFGFFTQSLPVMMRQQGYSLPDIGMTSLLALPWGLKFLWAPLVDRYGSPRFGRRRSFIVPLQLSTVLLLVGLAQIDPTRLDLFMAAILAVSFFSATQDIATDGLAVGILREQDRGLGNGLQVAAYRVGMIVGGGLLLMYLAQLGWAGAFYTMAAITLLCTIPVLLHKEEDREPELGSPNLLSMRWYWRPGLGRWVALLVMYKLGDALASAMVKPLLVDRGLDLEDVGYLSGTIGSVMGLTGALWGGLGARRFGRQQALLIFGLLQALSVAAYGVVAYESTYERLVAVTALEHLTGGMATVALFTAMMDRCRPKFEATDYTVQASAVVFATGGASAISGVVAEKLGYVGHFGVA
ncbi:MAG TPA: MFS transporter, partial [Myxococcota bacterium]|nr:MFS transporter [Myxococcota bacterium]